MSKKAWLLDDGIFLEGVYKRKGLKHIFIPDDMRCGFNYQYVNKKDMGKLVFFSQEDIIHANLKYYDVTEVLNLADSIINMETGPLSLEPYSFYKESGKFLLRAIFIYVCSDTQINKSEDVEKQIVEKDFLRVQRLLNEAKLNEEGISLLESRMKLLNIKNYTFGILELQSISNGKFAYSK